MTMVHAWPTERATRSTEGGNIVALILLGLALAVVAGVIMLYIVGGTRQAPVPVSMGTSTAEVTPDADPRSGWGTYHDPMYGFSVQYPQGWLIATGTLGTLPVITIAPGVADASSTALYHSAPTRVSVYPLGGNIPDLAPHDREQQSTVIVPVPQAVAKDYALHSKRPWASVVRFEQPLPGWAGEGFVFARARIEDEGTSYWRADAEVAASEYSTTTDQMFREGFVDPTIRGLEEEILRSLSVSFEEGTKSEKADAGDEEVSRDIRVTAPEAYATVTPPLIVRGEARGSWFFEGSFPVRLETEGGETLTQVPARALGEWMTDAFVPFEVSVSFAVPTATSARLVLSRDDPRGNGATNDVIVPVYITP